MNTVTQVSPPPLVVNRKKGQVYDVIVLIAVPLFVTGMLWMTRLNDITLQEWILANVLVFFAWGSFRKSRSSDDVSIRLFPLISAMYCVYYVLALFWGQRVAPGSGRGRALTEPMVEMALFFCVMGVVSLWAGMKTRIGSRMLARRIIDYPERQSSWNYIRLLLLISIPLSFASQGRLAYLFGAGGRQFMMIITGVVPLVILVLLVRRVLRKQGTPADYILLGTFLFVRMLSGIASGWLGTGASIIMVCGAVYLVERRKIPMFGVALLMAYMLFFQAGKDGFRRVFWGDRVESSISERIAFWSTESLRNWQDTLADPSLERWKVFSNQSLGRISLLQQTANVLDMSPDAVPFQKGRTYVYMIVGFIPRFVWPDKPSVNDANRFYQVAYGITDPDDLESVSVSAGALAESYINFGWMGLLLIMFPLGIFLDFYEHTFLTSDAGAVLNAIGIAILPSLLGVESQLAVYLGGIAQSIVLTLVTLTPILMVSKRSKVVASKSTPVRNYSRFIPVSNLNSAQRP